MSTPAHTCTECGEALEQTGRLTWYCPSCDTCPTCGCPAADGFTHYAGCADAPCECAYCGRETVACDPREMDEGDWTEEAARHAPTCEWIVTRAHTR